MSEATSVDAQPAYQAQIRCRHASRDEDGWTGCEPDHDTCDWTWFCNVCDREIGDGGCPEHAPAVVPGLQVVSCDVHPRTWLLADDGYEPPCPWCQRDDLAAAHDKCAHSSHGRWRRWRITCRLLGDLYNLGVIRGYGTQYDRYCRGCASGITFGRNHYALGWPRWKWQCLRAGHWPGEEVIDGICGKCSPCTGCGSQRYAHNDRCPAEAAA